MKNFLKKGKKEKNLQQGGFTLAETIITIFIFSIIMLGTTLMLKDIFSVNRQQLGVINTVDQIRRVANAFTNELRNATYGVNGSYPVNEASNNQIIFFSTTPLGNGTVSKIRYYIVSNTLYKGITHPIGNPLTYTGATETITTLSTNMSLGGNPLFYYYDGNYSGSENPLTQPVNLTQIKFIRMKLVTLKQLTKDSTNTFEVSAGASLRNLKNNLGN